MSGERQRSSGQPFSGHTAAKGRRGETDAAGWLEEQGLRIVARNVRTVVGEIDIVARDGETLCFVEVKARAGFRYGLAVEAVTAAKRRRLARAASMYLADHPHPGPCRFDVLALDPAPRGWAFTWVRDAFSL